MILVERQDGYCRTCGGQLKITGVDDCSLQVECLDCGDAYQTETDAFHDGGITYWPDAMAEFSAE